MTDVAGVEHLLRVGEDGQAVTKVGKAWQRYLADADDLRAADEAGDEAKRAGIFDVMQKRYGVLMDLLPEINGQRVIADTRAGLRESIDGMTQTHLITHGKPITDLKDLSELLSSHTGLLRLNTGMAAREAVVMPGRLSWWAERKAAGETRKAASTEKWINYADKDGKFIPNEAEQALLDAADDPEAVRAGLAQRAQMLKTTPLLKPTWENARAARAKIERVARRFTTQIPNVERMDLGDQSSAKTVEQIARMYLNRGDSAKLASAYALAPDVASRRAILRGVLVQSFHASGLSRSEAGRNFMERFIGDQSILEKQQYGYAKTSEIATDRGNVQVALYPDQISRTVILPVDARDELPRDEVRCRRIHGTQGPGRRARAGAGRRHGRPDRPDQAGVDHLGSRRSAQRAGRGRELRHLRHGPGRPAGPRGVQPRDQGPAGEAPGGLARAPRHDPPVRPDRGRRPDRRAAGPGPQVPRGRGAHGRARPQGRAGGGRRAPQAGAAGDRRGPPGQRGQGSALPGAGRVRGGQGGQAPRGAAGGPARAGRVGSNEHAAAEGALRRHKKATEKSGEIQAQVADKFDAKGIPSMADAEADLKAAKAELKHAQDLQVAISHRLPYAARWVADNVNDVLVGAVLGKAMSVFGKDWAITGDRVKWANELVDREMGITFQDGVFQANHADTQLVNASDAQAMDYHRAGLMARKYSFRSAGWGQIGRMQSEGRVNTHGKQSHGRKDDPEGLTPRAGVGAAPPGRRGHAPLRQLGGVLPVVQGHQDRQGRRRDAGAGQGGLRRPGVSADLAQALGREGTVNKPLLDELVAGRVPDRSWLADNVPRGRAADHAIGQLWAPYNPAMQPGQITRGMTGMMTKAYDKVVTDQINALSRNPLVTALYMRARENTEGYVKHLIDEGFDPHIAEDIGRRIAAQHAETRRSSTSTTRTCPASSP
jgi:hypothetical protein